jgi:hypothetical protein
MALHLSAACYPLLPIGATGAESIGVTGANDLLLIGATGAAHLLRHICSSGSTENGCPPPCICTSDSSPKCFLPMHSRHSLAWILSPVLPSGSSDQAAWKGMVLPYSISLILGAAAPARAVAHNSFSRLSEYCSTVLLSGLWRPAMEAALALEFTRLVSPCVCVNICKHNTLSRVGPALIISNWQ